jgi:hypothetical protein
MRNIFIFTVLLFFSLEVFGAAAFAQALDKDGNAVTWTFSFIEGKNVGAAKRAAVKQLKSEGHAKVKAAKGTGLNKGYFAVLYTAYWVKGVLKKSYAFGFSSKSEEAAKSDALKSLKKLKGWKEDQGYSVNKTGEF